MKARLLKKILNNTGYTVNNNEDYIAVGSPMCHDLISVRKKTLKLKYALDTFNEGRKALEKDSKPSELLFIYDKLQELIDNGQINDIINGNDEIENPLPVFTVENGKLIETFTDKYGYPNTTVSGEIIYDNTYFKTKHEAIKYGINDCELGIKNYKERFKELQEKLTETSNRIDYEEDCMATLKSQLETLKLKTT